MDVVISDTVKAADVYERGWSAATPARVSVVIPCRNEERFIAGLLDAIRAQGKASEVIVVDNDSTDRTAAVAGEYAARHPDLPIVVLHCAVEGAAAALNTGIARATGDVIVRLDGHSLPMPGYISRAVERLREPGAGVVGGVWEITASARTIAARAIALAVSHPLGTGGAAYRHGDRHRQPKDVDTVPFGCFTRELWASLGGYDDRLLVVEDGDFNYRARVAGRRVILDPAIRSIYHARPTMAALAAQYFRYGWWKVSMLMAHPGAARLRQAAPALFVTVLCLLGLSSVFWAPSRPVLTAAVLLYGSAVLTTAGRIAFANRDIRLLVPIACALGIVHFSWGGGALVRVLTAGRWPRWRTPQME